jgi:hypothetical protein
MLRPVPMLALSDTPVAHVPLTVDPAAEAPSPGAPSAGGLRHKKLPTNSLHNGELQQCILVHGVTTACNSQWPARLLVGLPTGLVVQWEARCCCLLRAPRAPKLGWGRIHRAPGLLLGVWWGVNLPLRWIRPYLSFGVLGYLSCLTVVVPVVQYSTVIWCRVCCSACCLLPACWAGGAAAYCMLPGRQNWGGDGSTARPGCCWGCGGGSTCRCGGSVPTSVLASWDTLLSDSGSASTVQYGTVL